MTIRSWRNEDPTRVRGRPHGRARHAERKRERQGRILITRGVFLGLFFIFITHRPSAAQQHPAATPSAPRTAVRVFLDCNRCDEAFLKREVTFIDYVRNREDADVHVLVTTQRTGSGGTQFVLQFIGQGAFRGVDQSLTYSASQTATSDEIRAGFAQMFTLGLVRYAAESTLADRLHVTVDAPA